MSNNLLRIYLEALSRCAPESLSSGLASTRGEAGPVDLLAIGKCAAGLFDGASRALRWERGLVAIPEGYPRPRSRVEVVEGSHPKVSDKSFAAGRRVADFVQSSTRPVLVLVSGGASASLELPLAPWFSEDEVAATNDLLVRAGLKIESMNTVRKHISSIKGGRLAALAGHGLESWIYSDVSQGREEHVASGPTLPDSTTNSEAASIIEPYDSTMAIRLRHRDVPETPKILEGATYRVIADNSTLVRVAAEIAGWEVMDEPLNDDVDDAARRLHARLQRSASFVAGGEPTVIVRGAGRGGRCSELAVRFARLCIREGPRDVQALFASSDGVDGNSGCAGFVVSIGRHSVLDEGAFRAAIDGSDTYSLAGSIGEPVLIPPTGNNLRDLFIVARPSHATG